MPLRRSLLVTFCLILSVFVPLKESQARTLGVIITRGEYFYEKVHESLLSRLKEAGYLDKVEILVQRPYPDPIAWSNASRKLIAAEVDAIITYGTPSTFAAVKERSGIPVVYVGVYEPVAADITAKNVTGVCSKYQVSSLIRYLRDSVSLRDLGVVYSSIEEDSDYQLSEIKKFSQRYGFAVTALNMKNPYDIEGMLSGVKVNAIFITASSMANSVLPSVLRAAEDRRIPTASLIMRDDMNATMTLSNDPEEMGREAADKLVMLLRGASPKDIPASCSRKIELVVNLRDARKIGIRVSMDLVTEATKVIY
jgi:putative ABC transport system substrate-binding protein